MARFTCMTVAMALAMTFGAAAATLTTEPDRVVFDSANGSATVKVLADGTPVPASQMHGFHLMVGNSDYGHMFRFTKGDGTVTLTPSPTVEVGSYDLRIVTDKGDAWLKVYTPLGEHQTSLQMLAQKLNMSVDELKRQTGMSKEMGRDGVSFTLPPLYPVGRTLTMDMGTPAEMVGKWEVDGRTLSEGKGRGGLEYLFKEAGPHLFTYTESSGDTVASKASAMVEGVDNPARETVVEVNTKLVLEAPQGYGQYTWTVDGKQAGNEPKLDIKRGAPCEVLVAVLSEKPEKGRPGEFDETTFKVRVTSKK